MARVITRRVVRFALWLLVVVVVVGVASGAMILVFGRVPDRAERGLVGPALLAIAIAVTLIVVLHDRMRATIDRVSGRDTAAPADLARSLSSRMSRSVPLDELVQPAAEGLRASVRLGSAEIWLLTDGALRMLLGNALREIRRRREGASLDRVQCRGIRRNRSHCRVGLSTTRRQRLRRRVRIEHLQRAERND